MAGGGVLQFTIGAAIWYHSCAHLYADDSSILIPKLKLYFWSLIYRNQFTNWHFNLGTLKTPQTNCTLSWIHRLPIHVYKASKSLSHWMRPLSTWFPKPRASLLYTSLSPPTIIHQILKNKMCLKLLNLSPLDPGIKYDLFSTPCSWVLSYFFFFFFF